MILFGAEILSRRKRLRNLIVCVIMFMRVVHIAGTLLKGGKPCVESSILSAPAIKTSAYAGFRIGTFLFLSMSWTGYVGLSYLSTKGEKV